MCRNEGKSMKKIREYIELLNWKILKLYDRIDILDVVKIIKNRNSIKCYLLDTPVHGNLGDQAIAIAERQVFLRYNVSVKEIISTKLDKKERIYSKIIPKDKCIFVQGGGFLGNLWPKEEEQFRNILKCFKDHKIVVFPQTITFDSRTQEGQIYLKESQIAYSNHKNLVVFVRERNSYIFMKEYFPKVKSFLVPDIVTLLHKPINASGRAGVLFCMRLDKEKSLSDKDIALMEKYLEDVYVDERIEYTDTVLNYRISEANREREVRKKLEQFAKSKIVVTDRLHGMIFAAITGTPCIALNNSNGKVGSVYNWIKENEYIKYAENLIEFKAKIHELNLDKKYKYNFHMVEDKFSPLFEVIKNN